jgi:prevent-host-death family protein
MAAIDITQAQDNFSDTIDRVAEAKERITLTRNGRAVAVLVPVEDARRLDELENGSEAGPVTSPAEERAEEAVDREEEGRRAAFQEFLRQQESRREELRRIAEAADVRAGIPLKPTMTIEELRAYMENVCGVRPEDNAFSRDIIRARYPEEMV